MITAPRSKLTLKEAPIHPQVQEAQNVCRPFLTGTREQNAALIAFALRLIESRDTNNKSRK